LLGGVRGKDAEADRLAASLREAGVDTAGLVIDPSRPTTTKTRIIAHSQQVVRVDHEEHNPLSRAVEDRLLGWAQERLGSADVCVLSDYAKGVVSTRFAQEFIRLARQKDKPVIVDPKGPDYGKYRGATVIKPNMHEAERVLKLEIQGNSAWLAAGQQLMALLPESAFLITRGGEGMSLFRAGAPPLHIPSVARDVFDVTGAGDTVVATLALALACGASLQDCAFLANRAAGIVVGKVGTAAVTLAELQQHLGTGRPSRARARPASPRRPR
jgi:D-beta-D-heptose 7-phosphate kinase/D-beta-D-heptose 1-phosphate adenosyltransferase